MFGFSKSVILVSLFLGLLNLFFSYILTFYSLKIAEKWDIVDHPNSSPDRKKQLHPVPLLGATGFIFSSLFFTGLLWLFRKNFFESLADPSWSERLVKLATELGQNLEPFRLIWVFVAIGLIVFGGFLDDKFQFKSKIMILPSLLAILTVVFLADLKIEVLSEPFNQFLPKSEFFYRLLAFFWIGICLTATKFLDGSDGLVATTGIISLLAIAFITLSPNVSQPLIFGFSLIWVFGVGGFLPWNLPDAKVYLGEAGSQIIGFIIGILSILSGAKIATVATVIGWFILDILFVLSLRLLSRKNPLKGDRLHWHFRLVDTGFSKSQVLGLTAIILVISAVLGVVLPTSQKVLIIPFQAIFLLSIFGVTSRLKSRMARNQLK